MFIFKTKAGGKFVVYFALMWDCKSAQSLTAPQKTIPAWWVDNLSVIPKWDVKMSLRWQNVGGFICWKRPKWSNINMFKWSKSALKTQVWILLHHNFEDECVFVCDRMLSLTENRLKAQKDYILSRLIKLVSLFLWAPMCHVRPTANFRNKVYYFRSYRTLVEGGFLKLYETRFTSLHLRSTQLLFDLEINNFSNVYSLFLRTRTWAPPRPRHFRNLSTSGLARTPPLPWCFACFIWTTSCCCRSSP